MTKPKLMRVCFACGTEKPLSAFLVISPTGTRYGVVCATCRAAGKDKKEIKPGDEETVTTPGGARMGFKEKVFIDKEQSRKIKDLKDLFKKEAQKKELFSEKKKEDSELKEKENKDHRKFYLERNKQGFLSKTTPPVIDPERQAAIARTIERHEKTLENIKQEELIRQELQINSLDLSTYVDTNMAKFRSDAFRQSDVYKQFAVWLGSNAPIARVLNQFYHSSPLNQKEAPRQDKKPAEREMKGKEAIEDYLEQRSTSTRRR